MVSLFSLTFFGPVSYYACLLKQERPFIELHENYQRQSYRNRCIVAGSSGKINLIVPIIQGHTPGQPICDVKIDNRHNWQRNQIRTPNACYRHAPFYEFLFDEISFIWRKKFDFLWDLDLQATHAAIRLLSVNKVIQTTETYEPEAKGEKKDFRSYFHPKVNHPYPEVELEAYYQVFYDRLGFMPDLSILDLLFNLGTDALPYLSDVRFSEPEANGCR